VLIDRIKRGENIVILGACAECNCPGGGAGRTGLDPEEGAEQPAQLYCIQSEVVLQLWSGDREIYPIEVIHQDPGAEQDTDPPSASGYSLP
jgi:hypothetical protein